MKRHYNSKRIALCVAVVTAAIAFTGCTKYKLVAVDESSSESSSTDAAVASASVSVSGNDADSLPTSDILEDIIEGLKDDKTQDSSTAAASSSTVATEAASTQPVDDGKLQIVVMGDSIFDNYRTPTGIASLVASDLNANVYNIAVAGSTAGLASNNNPDFSTWSIANFIGVSHVLTGEVNSSILDGHEAANVLKTFDPAKTDYFIVEYGVNDFLSSIPRESDQSAEDMKLYSYRGGLESGINALKNKFPNATVILMTPGYTQFWNGGSMIGDCNTIDRGYGRLIDYVSTAVNEAQALNIPYINSYEDVNITGYSASDCLQDGIHPTDEGCKRYAATIEKKINELEAEKNGTTASSTAAGN